METKPDYWTWQYYVTRQWQPPKGVSKLRVAGFALVLASWSNKGTDIRPSAATVARAVGIDRTRAVKLRTTVVELGLFRVIGRTLPVPGIPILEITMPGAEQKCTVYDGPCQQNPWDEKCDHCGRNMPS